MLSHNIFPYFIYISGKHRRLNTKKINEIDDIDMIGDIYKYEKDIINLIMIIWKK